MYANLLTINIFQMMKKLLLFLATALLVGLTAQAMLTEHVTFKGQKRTANNTSYYSWQIQSIWGEASMPTRQGSSYTFSNTRLNFSPVVGSVDGTLNFQESTTYTDVVTSGTFTVIFDCTTLWFNSATLKTLSGTILSGYSVTVSSDKHTVTVSIPSGKTFGQIALDYVPYEPLSSSNTVIGGIASEYIYRGSAIEPVPTVTSGGRTLTAGTDYTVSYWASGEPGTARVIINGTGNYTGTVSKDYTIRHIAPSDFTSLGDNIYQIANKQDLANLALLVNMANNNCKGLTFRQTANITCDNTYTPIGGDINDGSYYFRGTYDGQGYTISGISVSRTGGTYDDCCVGLFGQLGSQATVENLVLKNCSFTAYRQVGGIAGFTAGIVRNCRVEGSVIINAGCNSSIDHGGIAGSNKGQIIGCLCAASVSNNGYSGCNDYGGIVGDDEGTVKDCLFTGTISSTGNDLGGIAGLSTYATYTNNYYTQSGLGGVEGRDRDGARMARTVTLGENIVLSGTETTYSVSGITAIDTTALRNSSGTIYSGATQKLTLNYTGEIPEGHYVFYTASAGTVDGNTVTMPNENVSINANIATPWTGSGTEDDPYLITTTLQLDLLAKMVNGTDGFTHEAFVHKFFKLGNDLTYPHTSDWNDTGSTENNYTAIGYISNIYAPNSFCGNFDGDGHTISGIRICKGSRSQGLFGVTSTGTIKNITLSDTRITGPGSSGGIVGYAHNGAHVENCHVTNTVSIHSATRCSTHGGIVGYLNYHNSAIISCTSAATLTVADTLCSDYGGIVGYAESGTVRNCLAIGATVPNVTKYVGAIAGRKYVTATLSQNYYYDCNVGGRSTGVGIGGNGDVTVSKDTIGALSVHALVLPDGVTASGECVTIGSNTYYAAGTTVTLNYSGEGNTVYSVNGTAIEGDSFVMPAQDVTITVAIVEPEFSRGDVDGNGSVGIGDITTLIDYILSGDATGVNVDAADCDQNGTVGISDVTTLIDYVLSGTW